MLQRLQNFDWGRWGRNLLFFTAPVLFLFFYQLSQGVDLKVAANLALIALYGALADFFRKYRETQ